MQTVYNYKISGRAGIPPSFKNMIQSSFSIIGKIRDIEISFLYDEEENLLHTKSFSGMDFPLFGNPITPEHLAEFLEASDMVVDIWTKQKYETSPIKINHIKDYSQMITDLEQRGIISVRNSNSFLAEDPRMFKFKFGESEDEEWSVDCLGTVLCKDITSNIEQKWEDTRFKTNS